MMRIQYVNLTAVGSIPTVGSDKRTGGAICGTRIRKSPPVRFMARSTPPTSPISGTGLFIISFHEEPLSIIVDSHFLNA